MTFLQKIQTVAEMTLGFLIIAVIGAGVTFAAWVMLMFFVFIARTILL